MVPPRLQLCETQELANGFQSLPASISITWTALVDQVYHTKTPTPQGSETIPRWSMLNDLEDSTGHSLAEFSGMSMNQCQKALPVEKAAKNHSHLRCRGNEANKSP
ncbi:hypothetical protein VPNG_09882 [Cytospora leucostoma]|uniref:Uncharacterized protein n=1 Tax=Cytospora leucostoma TaxID=1230097 RepID=A0A423VNP5_9PEZI|nr:hypothetical protein VPNG_09882 [Cytospora leucostoma]